MANDRGGVAQPQPSTEEPAYVTVERRDDGVALVRIDRPKANALSIELLRQLRVIAEALSNDPPGAVVVWGGERIFAAGADIVQLGQDSPEAVSTAFQASLGTLASIPRVVIAAVNGYALGGGLELALACDLRIVAQDAALGLPEVLLGVIPGGGGTQRLPRLVGAARAKEMIFTGRQVSADEALWMGLANQVVPPSDVLPTALALAGRLAAGAVMAHALAKSSIDDGLALSLRDGLHVERSHFLAAVRTQDAARGIQSFRENGPGHAVFSGR
ncbi:MAG: enoyl-CoA hydratase-related protein [Actinomycetota bacterium]|jgi:enoyl-CoA hydratase|nr:enoyl-CoA hydratase-related protein [Actinomycetota bacterium]